jgi:cell division control protein 12
METRKFGEPRSQPNENAKFKEEEEALRQRFTEQVKTEENRFRQWERQVRRKLRKKDQETYDSIVAERKGSSS